MAKRLTSFLARASLTIRSSIVPRLFVSSSQVDMRRPESGRTTGWTTVEPRGDDIYSRAIFKPQEGGPQKTDWEEVKDWRENKTGTHAINR
jgi:hypothetical protein